MNRKDSWLILACLAASIFFGVTITSMAGTNWSTSQGGAWNTPNDATVVPNQFLVIGATNPPGVANISAVSQPALQGLTLTQIQASTATFLYQIVVCTNCVNSAICIATGTTGGSQWVTAMSTGTTFSACK